eukprot:375121-Prymnesium_polylepis.1
MERVGCLGGCALAQGCVGGFSYPSSAAGCLGWRRGLTAHASSGAVRQWGKGFSSSTDGDGPSQSRAFPMSLTVAYTRASIHRGVPSAASSARVWTRSWKIVWGPRFALFCPCRVGALGSGACSPCVGAHHFY